MYIGTHADTQNILYGSMNYAAYMLVD